jgi:hypothetical protein
MHDHGLSQRCGLNVITRSERSEHHTRYFLSQWLEKQIVVQQRHATADDDAAGAAQSNNMRQCQGQPPTCALERLQGEGISIPCSVRNFFRIRHPRCLRDGPARRTMFKDVPCRRFWFELRRIEIVIAPQMPNLAGPLAATTMNLPVKDQRPANAGTDGHVKDR